AVAPHGNGDPKKGVASDSADAPVADSVRQLALRARCAATQDQVDAKGLRAAKRLPKRTVLLLEAESKPAGSPGAAGHHVRFAEAAADGRWRVVGRPVEKKEVIVLVGDRRRGGRSSLEKRNRFDLVGERDHVDGRDPIRDVAEAREVIEIPEER